MKMNPRIIARFWPPKRRGGIGAGQTTVLRQKRIIRTADEYRKISVYFTKRTELFRCRPHSMRKVTPVEDQVSTAPVRTAEETQEWQRKQGTGERHVCQWEQTERDRKG